MGIIAASLKSLPVPLGRGPGESFMAQIARNLTDGVDGFLAGHRLDLWADKGNRSIVLRYTTPGGRPAGIA